MTSYAYLGLHCWYLVLICCGTCDVSTLVGMTMHNIYIISMLENKRMQGNIKRITFVRLQDNTSFE